MSTPPPSTPSAPRSAAVLSVDEAIARGAKAASLATGDAPTMPPALDLKTRGASVHDIARRLGELQSVSPESQLDMARKMETSCFDAAKSVEDYKKKIDKRLAKAAKKRAASPAPPRATPTPPPRAPTPGSGPPRWRAPPSPAAAREEARVDAAGGEGLAAYRAEMLAAHGPVLRWWIGGAAARPVAATLRAVETGGDKLAAWLAGVDKTLADHATVARNVLDGLERAARKPGESDAACLGRLRATIPLWLWCDKLGQRKATLDAQLGACLERYAPKTLADVDVAAEVEKRLEDGDGVLALPRALPAVASLSLHRCGDYVATVPCDGFRAAVFLDRSGPDRSVVDVVVKALEISEAAPASRHALWRRVTADVDAAVRTSCARRRRGPPRAAARRRRPAAVAKPRPRGSRPRPRTTGRRATCRARGRPSPRAPPACVPS
ncbi:hypothetical protein JL720_2883 [Aureococcus anophagefferens]|nr:hypothetical protein JL720_2883 [Aureococcus anophagefferens]